MLQKIIARTDGQTFSGLQKDHQILKHIRRNHSQKGDKNGEIVTPVHRREFRRKYCRPNPNEKCKVLRFYFTCKKEFMKALKKYCNAKENQRKKYMKVGLANVKLRLCCRCHDAEKTLKTDLYFVNILDDSSFVRETLCYGCLGAIINIHNVVGNNDVDNGCTSY